MIGYSKKKKKKGIKYKLLNIVLIIAVPIAILVFWELIVKAGIVKATLVPPPTKLWETFVGLIDTGKLQSALIISFERVLTGFFIGTAAGIVIGFLMGLFEPFNKALSVIVSVLRPIPTIALIPIFIIIFGIGETSNVSIIIVGAFWPVLLNTISGIQNVDSKLLELAYVYRIDSFKTIFKIILPSAVTSIITGVRLALGTAWMSVVAAEMIGASSGIGYMIMYARELAQAANMYVCVLIIGLVGLALDKILLVIQKKTINKFNGIAA